MRKFLLSSPHFTGQVEIVFNANDIVETIDFSNSNTTLSHRKSLLERFGKNCTLDALQAVIEGTAATIIEAEFELSFTMFWNAYGLKINKKRCEPLWAKLNKTNQLKAWQGISGYDKFLKRNTWRSKADPETYLRNEMWENEWK